jgi:hypothetical protein
MTRADRPRPIVCTILWEAVLVGEADGHGPVGPDELTGPAVWSRPAERFPPGASGVGLELGEPVLAEPLAAGLLEVAALLAWAPGVPVVPELGSLGEVSLVVGDGEVVVGRGLVGVGPGEVLVLVGAELFELPGDGLMVGDAELLTW